MMRFAAHVFSTVLAIAELSACGSGNPQADPGVDARTAIDAATADGPEVDAATIDGAATDASIGDATATDGFPSDGGSAIDAFSPSDANLPPTGEVTAPPYLMWPTQDQVSVRWETDNPVIGRVDYGTDLLLGSSVSEAAAVTTHELRLTDLAAGALIYYQVSFGGYQLPIASFHSAPPDDDDSAFRFLVWGDNQDGVETFETIVDLMIAEQASFALSVGDAVSAGTRANYRDQILGPIGPLAGRVPFLIAGGNHERYTDTGAALFDEYYSQPGDEHCFGWRWGELYVVVIDTDLPIDPGTTQGDCITAALSSTEATEATYRAAVFHKPPRIEWWFGGLIAFTEEMEAPWIREVLEPMLEDLDVDLVFNGHNHLYAYTPETEGGITFVTTGGGGGSLDTDMIAWRVGDWPEIDTTIHEHHFLSVEVTATEITVTAVGTDGSVLDQFTVAAP